MILSSLTYSDEVKKNCDVRSLLEAHKNFYPENQQVISTATGHWLNPYFKHLRPVSSQEEITSPTVARAAALQGYPDVRSKADVLNLVDDLKKKYIFLISAGVPQKSLNLEQQNMIQRIQNTKIEFPNCSGSEGSRDRATGKISLCQNVLKMPRLALAALIGHEIGHGLDLCGLTGNEDHLPGVSFDRNPTRPVYACLSNTNDPDYGLPSDLQTACRETKYTETSAQIWSAAVLEAYLKDHPVANLQEALGLFANSTGSLNKKVTSKEKDMNQIYLSLPGVQSVFGCQPQPLQNCMSHFKASGYGTPGRSNSTSSEASSNK